jgi:hypothetical protein
VSVRPAATRLGVALLVVAGVALGADARAASLPLVFEPLPGGAFAVRGSAWSAELRGDGARLRVARAAPADAGEPGRAVPVEVRLRLVGARADAPLAGEAPRASVSHVLVGSDASRWRRAVPHYGRVRAAGALPGIDVVYHADPQRLETDFEVAPGADPGAIALAIEGADDVSIDAAGDLVIRAGGAVLRQSRPVAYQTIDGVRRPVAARFALAAGGRVGFALGRYDPAHRLVIDPVLSYATYLGGSTFEVGRRVAADALGNTIVTGRTMSLDWPLVDPLQPDYGGGVFDAFLAKLDAHGDVVWSTYFGGSGEDWGYDVALDAAGYVHFVGRTDSPDLPVVRALQPALAGDTDCFLGKLRPDGSGFVFLTYLGTPGHERPRGVAADRRGRLVAVGFTSSPDFPLVNPIQADYGGGAFDAFVAIVSPFGDRLEFSTLLGGEDTDVAVNVAVDAAGRPVVTGFTDSADFPLANAAQAVKRGISDAFVAMLDPDAPALVYSTFLGGSGDGAEGDELGADVGLDAAGNAIVAGRTRSADFPVVGGIQSTLRGGEDAFVAKLAPDGALLYSTYLGGSGGDEARALAVDGRGLAFVTGRTSSADFPIVSAVQSANAGGIEDVFVAILSADGGTLLQSTYLGGSQEDDGFGIAVDAQSNAYVVGETSSTDFPTAHAAQPANAGSYESFSVKLAQAPDVAVRLAPPLDAGRGPRLGVDLANGALGTRTVELKLWVEAPGLAPLSLVGVSFPRLTLAPGQTIALLGGIELPPALFVPGAAVGARLLDGANGAVLAESLCTAVPCH